MSTPGPLDFAVTLTRLEGKVDTLGVKVDAGDKAAAQLVELVKTELRNVQASVQKLEAVVTIGLDKADTAVSKVRTDLQAQLERLHEDLEGQIKDVKSAEMLSVETQAQERRRLYTRVEKVEGWTNRLIGGCLLAGGLGITGLIALVRGLIH